MPTFIDRFLNGITMYRLVLYVLSSLAAVAIVLGSFGVIASSGIVLAISLGILFATCYVANLVLAEAFKAPTNPESSMITALILFFVMAPSASYFDGALLVLAGIIAIASKYLVAYRYQHLFNPVAFAAVVVGIPTGAAVWWVGTPWMLPFTLVAALLTVRKVRRFSMFLATVGAGVVAATALALWYGQPVPAALSQFFLSWPIVFFAAFMVTEPLTAPGTRRAQVAYGAAAGFFSSLPLHLGAIYSTPELTLLVANAVSFWRGLRRRLLLSVSHVKEIARDTYEFAFAKPAGVTFRAGQYLEWTVAHKDPDLRGIRRYFTIASAPEDELLRIGIKIAEPGSSFKRYLKSLKVGDVVSASTRSGSFVLPADEKEKLAFIAGGIGITPFRSMASHLIETGQQRDVALFYAARTHADVAYADLFAEAGEKFGMRTTYVFSDEEREDAEHGFLSRDMIEKLLPDYASRTFYLSGPDAMVQAYKKLLRELGIGAKRIHTDYFPGF